MLGKVWVGLHVPKLGGDGERLVVELQVANGLAVLADHA